MSLYMRDYGAKRLDNNEWEDGNLIILSDGSGRAFIARKTVYGKGELYEVDPSTVSQCTGRADSKRFYINEYDIVEEEGGHRSIVKYCAEEAKYILESKNVVTELGNKKVTVIGNVFDNPELIP